MRGMDADKSVQNLLNQPFEWLADTAIFNP